MIVSVVTAGRSVRGAIKVRMRPTRPSWTGRSWGARVLRALPASPPRDSAKR